MGTCARRLALLSPAGTCPAGRRRSILQPGGAVRWCPPSRELMRLLERASVGAEAGLLAGASVVVFFLVQDAFVLRPLATPLALTSGLLGEPLDLERRVATAATVGNVGARLLTYTVLHFLAFAALGVAAAFLIPVRSFWTSLWSGVVFGSLASTGLLYASRWVADVPVALDTLGMPSVLLANAMAGAILGVTLHLAGPTTETDGPSG
jgi:hypothetical protein